MYNIRANIYGNNMINNSKKINKIVPFYNIQLYLKEYFSSSIYNVIIIICAEDVSKNNFLCIQKMFILIYEYPW